MSYYKKHVLLCTNQKGADKKCCANSGGEAFFDYLKSKLIDLEMHGPGKIRVSKSGCLGRCSLGPSIVVYPEGIWYTYFSFRDIDEIIQSHLIAGNTVPHLLMDKDKDIRVAPYLRADGSADSNS